MPYFKPAVIGALILATCAWAGCSSAPASAGQAATSSTASIFLPGSVVPTSPVASLHRRDDETRYDIVELGSLGGTSCCNVVTINDRGWVDGTSNLPGDQNSHAFLWIDGKMRDLGTLGGPNSSAGGMDDRGDVSVGGADTGKSDPLGEDPCGFGTFQTCLSFVWNAGRRTLIPSLGGNSNDISGITNSGLINAMSETAYHDPTCIAPQVLAWEAYIWDPAEKMVQRLPPLPGDSVSITFDMNEHGDAVGYSGSCDLGLGALNGELHAVIWRNGKPTDLGNLGGTIANTAFGINNRDQVVGLSALAGNITGHAFLWQHGSMTDLGALPGFTLSVSGNINDRGQVPIQSCDAFPPTVCRAAIWQDGRMTDLNALINSGSSLFLVSANWVNEAGDIVGTAVDQNTGSMVPFLAVPHDERDRRRGSGDSNVGVARRSSESILLPVRLQRALLEQLKARGLRAIGDRF